MLAALVDILLGLWWAAIAATVASVLAMRAVWFGVVPRIAGAIAAVGVGVIAVSYWCDIADVSRAVTVDMRRGAGLALWPALAFMFGACVTHVTRQVD